jgi:hypothetical protein
MRALAPDRFSFHDRFQIVHRRKERVTAAGLLVECLNTHVRPGSMRGSRQPGSMPRARTGG